MLGRIPCLRLEQESHGLPSGLKMQTQKQPQASLWVRGSLLEKWGSGGVCHHGLCREITEDDVEKMPPGCAIGTLRATSRAFPLPCPLGSSRTLVPLGPWHALSGMPCPPGSDPASECNPSLLLVDRSWALQHLETGRLRSKQESNY